MAKIESETEPIVCALTMMIFITSGYYQRLRHRLLGPPRSACCS